MRFVDMLVRDKIVNKTVKQIPIIVGDESLAAIEGMGKRNWLNKDFPCVAPPFQQFWVEARSSVKDMYWGTFVTSIDAEKCQPDTKTHMYEMRNKIQPHSTTPLPDPRWYMMMFPFARIKKDYVISNTFGVWLLDAFGGIINPKMMVIMRQNHVLEFGFNFPPNLKRMDAQDFQKNHPDMSFANFYPFAMRTIALVNCVNVDMVEVQPVAAMSKRHMKKYKVPLSSWYEYRMKANRYAAAETVERTDNNDIQHRRQHFCRGHFKRRKSGVYWWSDMIRGHAELGTIQKKYIPNERGK